MMQNDLEFGDYGIAEEVESKTAMAAKRQRGRLCCFLCLALAFAAAGAILYFLEDIKGMISKIGEEETNNGGIIDVDKEDDHPLPDNPFHLDDDGAKNDGHSWDDDSILPGDDETGEEQPAEDDDDAIFIDDDIVDDDEVADDDALAEEDDDTPTEEETGGNSEGGEETPPPDDGEQPADGGSEPGEETPESPEGGDEGTTGEETGAPGESEEPEGEETETPTDDGEQGGNEEETADEGDEAETPEETDEGEGEETPDEGEETETPGEETPEEGEEAETSDEETPEEGEETETPGGDGGGEETPDEGKETDTPTGDDEETAAEPEETPAEDGAEQPPGPPASEEQPPAEQPAVEDGGDHASWLRSVVTKDDGVKFEVVREFPHDENAFTQGLTFHEGTLYESTGLNGGSSVRILNTETGDVEKKVNMEHRYFGEGMTYYKDKLVQITWKLHTGFVYDTANLDEPPTQFKFDSVNGEGWGITYDDIRDEFIVSDGSPFLLIWKPDCIVADGHCEIERKVQVTRINGDRGGNINELEFWRGRVLANVWFEDVLLVINPETGMVEKEYAFETSEIFPKKNEKANVFNGISVTGDPDTLFVTGKKWNTMFEVRLMEGKTPEQFEKDKEAAAAAALAAEEAAKVPELTPEEIQEELEHQWVVTPVSKQHGKMYEIVEQYPHDNEAFTQGLTYFDETLYESTGLNGHSTVRVVDLETGIVERSTSLEKKYFGEGLAYINGKLVQLTWKNRMGFVYNPDNLAEPPKEFTYNTTNGEGWGITYNPEEDEIYVSDGSEYICVWAGDCFETGHCGMIRTVPTYRIGGEPGVKINELEFWRGRILANIWYEDVIAVINPTYGSFEKEYEMKDLWPKAERKKAGADVLNGISVAEDPNTLLVTGKLWDRIFEIKLLTPEDQDEERL